MQLRTTAIVRAIRLIEAALVPCFARRERIGIRWVFFGTFGTITMPVVGLDLPPSRRLADLSVPPLIRILERDLVSKSTLERLVAVVDMLQGDHGQ
jgi:hypothetical protein